MATQEAASVALSNSVLEVGDHGSSTLATILPLLISPARARYAAGVESVIKSQVSCVSKENRLSFGQFYASLFLSESPRNRIRAIEC